MLKQLALFGSILYISACDDVIVVQERVENNPQQSSSLQQYRRQAANLLIDIRSNQDAASLELGSAQLVRLSQVVFDDFLIQFPQCSAYLNSLRAVDLQIADLPVAQILSDYQHGKKLTKFEEPICYHAKELLVHGAMVQAVAGKGLKNATDYNAVELDIIEAMAHLDQIEVALAD